MAAADAESSHGWRRYVKLRKEETETDGDNAPAAGAEEDILPGELNQAVQLKKKYHLKDSPCHPWLVHGTLHWCANCQEHRERKGRLDAKSAAPATIVSPPPVQEMSMAEIRSPTPAPENEAAKTGHDNAEVVTPL